MNACRKLALVLALLATAAAVAAQKPRPLAEADVLKLVELQIDDGAVADRILAGPLDFAVDSDLLQRLKKAGASETVLAALRKAGKLPAAEADRPRTLMVWTRRFYASTENPLQSELAINGHSLGAFKSESQRSVEKYLKKGWNVLTVKTTPQAPANGENFLQFSFGPVSEDPMTGRPVMERVYWTFWNSDGWSFEDGKYKHALGPDVKDVTLTFKVYYAGPDHETDSLRNGDYVLSGASFYASSTPSVTTTVFVNGTPLNSFAMGQRTLKVTRLLKKGKNEIKLVSARVGNHVNDNDVTMRLMGPAKYNVTERKYLVGPVVEFNGLEGWGRDQDTGLLVSKSNPSADTVERVITFNLDEEPKSR